MRKVIGYAHQNNSQTHITAKHSNLMLVVDDDPEVREKFSDMNKTHRDIKFSTVGDMKTAIRLLRSEEFSVILLDGTLKQNNDTNHGQLLGDGIRNSRFGDVNKNTPIINISSVYDNTRAVLKINKYRLGAELPNIIKVLNDARRIES